MSSGVDWIDAITIDGLEEDPFPLWARMRAEKPIAFIPVLNAYALTTYDEIREFLSDAELSQSVPMPVLDRTFGPENILNANGDLHRDRRASVDPPLRRNAVRSYIDDLIRPIAIEYAAQLPYGQSFDIMAGYLEPISTVGLATMLGIGDVPVSTLRRWFHTVIAAASNYAFDDDTFTRSDRIIEEIKSTLEPILQKLEDNPDNSALSHLLHAGMPEGQIRPRADIYSSFLIELTGGMQEPGHVAGTVLLGLCGDSSQYAEIVENPELIPAAITEGLRWIAPIGGNFRQASREVVIHGQTLPKGTVVLSVLSSANRDETKFDAPDRYDLHRNGPAHFSFGGGRHFCAGNVFGRELARIVLEELVKVAPKLELSEQGFKMRGWLFRAPQELHMVIGGNWPYQQLILAQGAANRELLLPGAHLNGIFALRTLSQVKGFRARLAAAENVVVIGGGFIGMEVAATASRTAAVTIIEQQERVLARAVAPLMSQAVESTHRNAGNDLRTGESVKELRGRDGHVTDVILGDGTAIPADVVVIGVGALPHTDIAARAGLEIANGILVDDRLRTNDPAIFAIGDCAARINRRNDTPQRLECVQNSVDQARHVAAQIVNGSAEPYSAVPYFWTNQFDLRIQTVGLGTRDDEFVVLGDPLRRAFSICRFSHGELVAVESLNRPRDHVAARKILNAAISLTPEVASLKGFDLNEHLAAGQRASPPIGAAC